MIVEEELTECIPSLMKFISTHDRSIHPSVEYTISSYLGLSHFKSKEVEAFLYSDFLAVLEMERGSTIDNKIDWIVEYMKIFNQLEIEKAKPLLYDFMYAYFGFNRAFKTNPKLFEQKIYVEDSISNRIKKFASGMLIEKIDVLALIETEGDEQKLVDYSARVTVPNSNQFDSMFSKLESKGFPNDHILMTTGNYTYSYGAFEIREFDAMVMREFLTYISKFPDKKDIEFMENLKKYNYATSKRERTDLDEYIQKAKVNINK